jgi:type IV pilus assembly protein PilW
MKAVSRRSRIPGFSLVELMIGLMLSSVLTIGVIQLFVANSESYNFLQGQSRVQESARFAFEFMGRVVRKAGYAGCFSKPAGLFTTLTAANLPYEYDLRFGVQGFNAAGGANWLPNTNMLPRTIAGVDTKVFTTPAGDGVNSGIDTTRLMQGSDILTVRNMGQDDYRLTQNMPISTEDIVVAAVAGEHPFVLDHLAIISDCEKATIFRITSIDEDTPVGDKLTIGHDIADVDATRNTITKLALVNTFEDDAAVSDIESFTFFVAPGTGLNESGNAPLSLWRKSGITAPVELIEGVEDMQVLYGVDTDEDKTPNTYTQANQVADWGDVTTIRITLVVNSVDDVGGTSTPTHGCGLQYCIPGQATDGLFRRSFTQTFQLRN